MQCNTAWINNARSYWYEGNSAFRHLYPGGAADIVNGAYAEQGLIALAVSTTEFNVRTVWIRAIVVNHVVTINYTK